MSSNFLVDLSNHTLQGLTRSTLCEVVSTISNHVLYALGPANRACQLSNQVSLDLSGISMRLTIYILINGALRCLDLGSLDSCLQLVLGGLHQWRVESTTHLQRQGTLGTSGLQLLASLVDGVDVTRDNQLTRVVVVGSYANALAHLADLSANLLDLLVGQTDDGSHG